MSEVTLADLAIRNIPIYKHASGEHTHIFSAVNGGKTNNAINIALDKAVYISELVLLVIGEASDDIIHRKILQIAELKGIKVPTNLVVLNTMSISAIMLKVSELNNVGCVIVDYLGIANSMIRRDTSIDSHMQSLIELCSLSETLDFNLIVFHQMSRVQYEARDSFVDFIDNKVKNPIIDWIKRDGGDIKILHNYQAPRTEKELV